MSLRLLVDDVAKPKVEVASSRSSEEHAKDLQRLAFVSAEHSIHPNHPVSPTGSRKKNHHSHAYHPQHPIPNELAHFKMAFPGGGKPVSFPGQDPTAGMSEQEAMMVKYVQ